MIWKKKGKRLWMMVLVCVLLLALIPGNAGASNDFFGTYKARLAKPVKKNPRILMVGNSHTYYNQMPAMLKAICREDGIHAYIEYYAISGHSLYQWAYPYNLSGSDKMKSKKLFRALQTKNWDYIVLQGNTKEMFSGSAKTDQAVKKLLSLLKSKKTQVIFYQTWAMQKGHADYASGTSVKEYQNRIIANYNNLANKFHGAAAPAGVAFRRAESLLPQLSLYISDKKHATKEGSYLAACVLYSTMFRSKARGTMSSVTGHMSSAQRISLSKELQQIAADVTLRSNYNNSASISLKSSCVLKPEQNMTISYKITGKTKYTRISSWISDNKRIASVSNSGKVTAHKPGTAKITAILNNGKKASCKVTVKG